MHATLVVWSSRERERERGKREEGRGKREEARAEEGSFVVRFYTKCFEISILGFHSSIESVLEKKLTQTQKETREKKKMEEEEEQPTSPHPGPEAFSLKMLVDSRNAGAVLGTRARRGIFQIAS